MGKRGPQPNMKKKKTYVCELCNKSFRDSFVLKVHNRLTVKGVLGLIR